MTTVVLQAGLWVSNPALPAHSLLKEGTMYSRGNQNRNFQQCFVKLNKCYMDVLYVKQTY